MKTCLLLLGVVSALAMAVRVNTDTFCMLDRETAGLMDAWTEQRNGFGGAFTAGTAMIRAASALTAAQQADTFGMPEEAGRKWNEYLKASADCLFSFRLAMGNDNSSESEEILLASFTRWLAAGEEFLNSVQSTR